MPDTDILSEREVETIEARESVIAVDDTGVCVRRVQLSPDERNALCRTVRALRAVGVRPAGWQAAAQRADPRVVTITFENADCAEAFIKGLQPVYGPITAATAMRDACVEKVRTIHEERLRELRRLTGAGDVEQEDAEYERAVLFVLSNVITAIQSLTLDQVKRERQP